MTPAEAAKHSTRPRLVCAGLPAAGRMSTRREAAELMAEATPALPTMAAVDAALDALDAFELPFQWTGDHGVAMAGFMNRGVHRLVAFVMVYNDALGIGWQYAYSAGRLAELYAPEVPA